MTSRRVAVARLTRAAASRRLATIQESRQDYPGVSWPGAWSTGAGPATDTELYIRVASENGLQTANPILNSF